MNWYRVKAPHGEYSAQDVLDRRVVLLEGGVREASLELLGFLEFVGVDTDEVVPEPVKKRSRRGKQVEAGPPESEPVESVSGDESRGEDRPAD